MKIKYIAVDSMAYSSAKEALEHEAKINAQSNIMMFSNGRRTSNFENCDSIFIKDEDSLNILKKIYRGADLPDGPGLWNFDFDNMVWIEVENANAQIKIIELVSNCPAKCVCPEKCMQEFCPLSEYCNY